MVLNGPSFAFFLCFMALILPKLQADVEGFDEVWHKRVEEAEKTAIEAYEPNPEKVTKHFNQQVRKVIEGTNGTRRYLKSKKNKGPCETTNPIDNCWRCKADWEQNRKQLAKCVLGFGHKTRGGVDGRIYVVTDASDDSMENPKPGTLRHACVQKEPLWIIFARSMVFRLENELLVASHKTIDARGANVHIAYGAGITIQFAQNVIIHGLHIHDVIASNGGMIRDTAEHCGFRTAADGDGVSIFQSTNVWLDHLSMSNCKDGLIDVIQGSTAITISNCHFTHHNDVMLFGASDTYERDKIMQITLAFNHFGKGLVQRMPRIRWGLVHIVNNDYTHWLMYAIGGSSGPTVISHGNRFIAPINNAAKEVTKRDYATEQVWRSWLWRSEGDLMMNGAIFVQSGDPAAMKFPFSKMDMIQAMPGTFVSHLTRFAGSLNCIPGTPC